MRKNKEERKERMEMRKNVLWVFLALLTVMSLVLTSCGTAEEEEEEGPTVIKGVVTLPPEREKEQAGQVYTEKPQYDGVANIRLAADVAAFDEVFLQHYAATTLHITNEEMMQGDWAKGPAGTGETDWVIGGVNAFSVKTGALADSWEIPTPGKMIFHIREGVHWQNKPPTNGRELTVEDVVFTFKRMCTEPGAYMRVTYPTVAPKIVITSDEAARTVTVDATACPSSDWSTVPGYFPDYCSIMPKDAVEYYGNLNDWKNSIGTGPFIMTDYVSSGSITFARNDNYWMTNPIGPGKGDQLPYLKGIKMLIITDPATAQTAFRTGKIDGYSGYYDDVREFLDNPDVKRMSYNAEVCGAIFMRTDKVDKPFSKLEVRQALMLATDFNKIKDEFDDGRATILGFPIAYVKEYKDAYVPMEKLPASTQELFSHNVTKAKELLAQAGYSTGFTTSIIFYSGSVTTVDYLSLIASMWAEAGITLKLDGRDYNTWVARIRARNFDDMLYYQSSGLWQKMQSFSGTSSNNQSYVNDARVNEALARALDLIYNDDAQLAKNFADLVPYVLDQSWVIPTPIPYTYVCWWPWVKNWNGELNVGYYNNPNYLKYQWIDQNLKQKMLSGK
jgi:peptide/nickel transport system substrate-binding protein